ncbi:MAG: redoxin domain-containing protein [Legionellales bacterium]|nr:redoxin domain-containing protein [Legionellales bacterium]
MLTIEQPIPNISFQATNQLQGTLADFRGQALVLYFYPKDNTPGCTRETKEFRDHYAQFVDCQTQILGVSRDSLASHEKFKTKLNLPFELISDAEETLCQAFDVIRLKNMFGKKIHGIERSTFLIDAQGQLKQQWRKVKVANHVAQVLAAAKSSIG